MRRRIGAIAGATGAGIYFVHHSMPQVVDMAAAARLRSAVAAIVGQSSSEEGERLGRHRLGQWFECGHAGAYVVVEAPGEGQCVGVVGRVDEHGR